MQNTIEQLRNNIINENSILMTLSILNSLIENCPNAIFNEKKIISQCLIEMIDLENLDIRISLGISLNSLLRNNKDLLKDLHEKLFIFFFNNIKITNYELNLTSAEFFLYILDEEENIIADNYILKSFENFLNL